MTYRSEQKRCRCPGCGMVYYRPSDFARWGLAIAAVIAKAAVDAGRMSGDAFTWCRKTLGIGSTEVPGASHEEVVAYGKSRNEVPENLWRPIAERVLAKAAAETALPPVEVVTG